MPASTSSPRNTPSLRRSAGGVEVRRLVRPPWLTAELEDMIERAKLKGWTVWHWPAGDSAPGETALISGGYDAAGIRARWKDIREGMGGESEPFLGLDRLREISETDVNVDLPDTAAQDSASKSNSPAVSG